MENRMSEDYLKFVYVHAKERYISQCWNLINRLDESIKKVIEDKFFGNPMSSSSVFEISELYGRLEELKSFKKQDKEIV
jgi:hypothetical protein